VTQHILRYHPRHPAGLHRFVNVDHALVDIHNPLFPHTATVITKNINCNPRLHGLPRFSVNPPHTTPEFSSHTVASKHATSQANRKRETQSMV
jgi:hypothetical protein